MPTLTLAHLSAMYVVPAHIFNPLNVRAGVVPNVISGGTSISGQQTVIEADGGGRWQIEWSGIDIDDPEVERLWDMWASHLAGGARPVLVPLLSLLTAPGPYVGGDGADPSDLVYDDDAFPTYVRFASPHIVASVITHDPQLPVFMEIEVSQGARRRGGEKFSIGNRAYLIERVLSRTGQRATVRVRPPRREPVSPGTPANFEWPIVQCRAELGQNLNPLMEFGRFSEVSVTFVEDFSDAD